MAHVATNYYLVIIGGSVHKKFWFTCLLFNAISTSTTLAWAEERILETAFPLIPAPAVVPVALVSGWESSVLPQGASGSWDQLELYLFGDRSYLGYWQKKSPVLAILEESALDRGSCIGVFQTDGACVNRRLARSKKLNAMLAGTPRRCPSYGAEPEGVGLSRGWGETPFRERWYLLCRNPKDTDWITYHIFIEYDRAQARSVEIGLRNGTKTLFCSLPAENCVTDKSHATLRPYY